MARARAVVRVLPKNCWTEGGKWVRAALWGLECGQAAGQKAYLYFDPFFLSSQRLSESQDPDCVRVRALRWLSRLFLAELGLASRDKLKILARVLSKEGRPKFSPSGGSEVRGSPKEQRREKGVLRQRGK